METNVVEQEMCLISTKCIIRVPSPRQTKENIRANLKQLFVGKNQNGLKVLKVMPVKDPIMVMIEEPCEGFYTDQCFTDKYEMQDILGEGTVGTVKKCMRIGDGATFAVKEVRTSDLEIILQLKNEFRNLKRLKHENIIEVYELYYHADENKIYLVMELVEADEMFEVIKGLGAYCERDACEIFRQILLALEYLHSQGVVHRDLKPNNILVDKRLKVKIVDFNVAKFSEKYKDYSSFSKHNYQMLTYTGTIAFSAPEIFLGGEYTEAVDMWSAGVVLYTMLGGCQPFASEFAKELVDQIVAGEYSFPDDPWRYISNEAKSLIKACLQKNPEERVVPLEALKHQWMKILELNVSKHVDISRYLRASLDKYSHHLIRRESISRKFSGERRQLKSSRSLSDLLDSRLKCDGVNESPGEKIRFQRFISVNLSKAAYSPEESLSELLNHARAGNERKKGMYSAIRDVLDETNESDFSP